MRRCYDSFYGGGHAQVTFDGHRIYFERITASCRVVSKLYRHVVCTVKGQRQMPSDVRDESLATSNTDRFVPLSPLENIVVVVRKTGWSVNLSTLFLSKLRPP